METAATASSSVRPPTFRRTALIGVTTLGVAAAIIVPVLITSRTEPVVAQSGPQRVQVAEPLPGDAAPGTGYRYYSARPDLTVNSRPAVDTFGVTDVVALPDGTIYALQDSRISVGDSDDHDDGLDWGRALVSISPDGVASIVDNPYADRERGRDVAPACASADGDLYAYNADDGSLVARSSSGEWRAVTAPDRQPEVGSTGDGGAATQATLGSFRGCAVTNDGSVYVTDSCLVRRIAPSGIIDTIAGRPEINDGVGAGCGSVANALATHTGPVPTYDGPATDAELGWLAAIAAGPDGSVWISAMWGVQQLTPEGWLRTTAVQQEMGGVTNISSLATMPDGTLLAAYGDSGPKGVSSRSPTTGEWTTLLELDLKDPSAGSPAPAPLNTLDLYRADLTTSSDRMYFGVAYGPNAGILAVPVT